MVVIVVEIVEVVEEIVHLHGPCGVPRFFQEEKEVDEVKVEERR